MILIIKRGIDDFNPIDSRTHISFNLKDGYIQMSYICKGPEHVQVNEPLDQLTLASYLTALICQQASVKWLKSCSMIKIVNYSFSD